MPPVKKPKPARTKAYPMRAGLVLQENAGETTGS